MKFGITVLFFLLALLTQPVYAIKVAGLYQGNVPVENESASLRRPAIKQALINVLVKLTGDRNISKNTDIAPLINQAKGFVQQFRYRQVVDQENPAIQAYELWVQFDEAALNEGLRSYGLSIWGSERPSILVWLVHEENNVRRLVSFEESPQYLSMLDRAAANRGISLLFPLLDLEDSSRISASDIWGGFRGPILAASDRYQANVVMTGKLVQTLPNIWESYWTIYINGQVMNWSSQGELAEIVLQEGVDEMVDRIASQYTNTGSTLTEEIELLVTDIDGLDEYARALSYLESVQSVQSVQVKSVSGDKVLFELINRGGMDVFDQSIVLGKTLEAVNNSEILTYRLISR